MMWLNLTNAGASFSPHAIRNSSAASVPSASFLRKQSGLVWDGCKCMCLLRDMIHVTLTVATIASAWLLLMAWCAFVTKWHRQTPIWRRLAHIYLDSANVGGRNILGNMIRCKYNSVVCYFIGYNITKPRRFGFIIRIFFIYLTDTMAQMI